MDSYQNDLYLNAQLFAKLRFTVQVALVCAANLFTAFMKD